VTVGGISIVCPTYESASFIGQTIATVCAQTTPPLELIISDDGSTDDTLAIVEELQREIAAFPIRLIRNAHRGPGAARNAGIRRAVGEWIAFLDSDDWWMQEKLARMEAAIRQYPEANFFSNSEYHRRLDGSESLFDYGAAYMPNIPLQRQLFHENLFSTSAIVCRRDLLLTHGLFDEHLLSSQDYELWLRLAPAIRPVFVRVPLGWYVDRTGNVTSGPRWRRLWNLLCVLHRHRRIVSFPTFLSRTTGVVASYLGVPMTYSPQRPIRERGEVP